MKRKMCVRSMVLGAVIMLVGLAVGAIVSPPLIAQRNGVFGDIECTGLTVVNKEGKEAVILGSREYTLWDDHESPPIGQNGIWIYDNEGNQRIELHTEALGSDIKLNDKDGHYAIMLRGGTDLKTVWINHKGKRKIGFVVDGSSLPASMGIEDNGKWTSVRLAGED